MELDLIAKVALENTTYSFDTEYDYLIPRELYNTALAGCRVLVPFGISNKKRQGIILKVINGEKIQRIKPIAAVLDKAPLLNEEIINLVVWMKNRYYCTYFDAIKLMRPLGIDLKIVYSYEIAKAIDNIDNFNLSNYERTIVSLLTKKKTSLKEDKLLEILGLEDSNVFNNLVELGIIIKNQDAVRKIGDASIKMIRLKEEYLYSTNEVKLTPKQSEVYKLLCEIGGASVKEICYFTGVTGSVVDSLVKKGIAEYFENEVYRTPYKISGTLNKQEIILTKEQNSAYQSLYAQYNQKRPATSLLYGVTGSGKTSVFMSLIDEVIKDNRGVIVMVPEISLTPQLLEKFHNRYKDKVAVFHSALSLGERLDEWKRIKNGDALIALGTRSAVFAPFNDVGLIIMDEEQEYTYKSEASPRFHARDVAKFRCKYNKALLVLSSATPSIESYFLARNGRYTLNTLHERYGDSLLPDVTIADMNLEVSKGNITSFSSILLESLNLNMQARKQSILLLNRRGYNTFASCRECGEVLSCPNCSISMTYHSANNRLMCHYCGYSVKFTDECPNCHENSVKYIGAGTQRAEEELEQLLPGTRILRMDADTTMSKFSYDRKLKQFENGEYDIMIGTQMVAKGLDFDNVTLAGVISADQALYSNDFRSYERAFSLLTQVVGRAGRRAEPGKAIIQTFTPENEIIQMAAKQDYNAFYNNEIQFRKTMLYPPFSDICVVGFVGGNEEKTAMAAREFFSRFKSFAKSKYKELPIRALPPSTALLNKLNNKYRYKIIIKCRNTCGFREMMAEVLKLFIKEKKFLDVSVFIDTNPDNIM